ncbi:MAG: DinB family protein [Acidobacteriota bacterium]
MSTYGAKHLAASFRTVRKNTIQVAEDIPEDQYSFVPADGTRSVAQTLVHVATMTALWQEIHGAKAWTNLDDFDFLGMFNGFQMQESLPRTKAEILELLRTEGESFAALLEGLSDQKLAEEVSGPFGAPGKTRLEALLSAKEHEMHHRAQLMLVERLLGIVPHLTIQSQAFRREYAEKMQERAAAKVG